MHGSQEEKAMSCVKHDSDYDTLSSDYLNLCSSVQAAENLCCQTHEKHGARSLMSFPFFVFS